MSGSPKLTHSLRVLASEQSTIPYRPDIAKKLGSVTAAILFQQVLYWYSLDGEFYKFKESCDSPYYARNDSWTEELGFTRREFDNAWKKIEKLNLASKRITQDRRTFYTLNEVNADAFVSGVYSDFSKRRKAPLGKGGKRRYQKAESAVRLAETTSETTTEKENPLTPSREGERFLSFSDLMKLEKEDRHNYLIENHLTPQFYKTTYRAMGINPRALDGTESKRFSSNEELMAAVAKRTAERQAYLKELEDEPVT